MLKKLFSKGGSAMIKMSTLFSVVLFFTFVVLSNASELTIRYNDGSVQKVQLKRPPSNITQITIGDELEPYLGKITVLAGTYGMNCGAQFGNRTRHLAMNCNGKDYCTYVIDVNVLGDPVVGCAKEYVAEWRCGSGPIRSAKVPAEAGRGSVINLTCQ